MREFINGVVILAVTGLTALVLFPLLPLWTFAVWFTEDDVDILDAAADVFDSYLKIIKLV